MKLKLSPQTLLILEAFLDRPADWKYGYDLSRSTGLKSGTLYPLLMRLADHEDPLVRLGLESTQHALGLMGRIVGQLTKSSAAGGGVLRREEFDLVTLAQRACSYHQPAAERKGYQ